ncbi:hypothetical protein [Brevibacillus sp. 179-C9.3 HS]|uniref:hypothetical protein n=1 Tax=unclassified Brevibacillus TaxID=2684853 RepID=UPI0039A26ADD
MSALSDGTRSLRFSYDADRRMTRYTNPNGVVTDLFYTGNDQRNLWHPMASSSTRICLTKKGVSSARQTRQASLAIFITIPRAALA